jgi:hypothetical protein
MADDEAGIRGFLLRLPRSLRISATQCASDEGISLNQFISHAVAEKVVRLQAQQTVLEGQSQRVRAVKYADEAGRRADASNGGGVV